MVVYWAPPKCQALCNTIGTETWTQQTQPCGAYNLVEMHRALWGRGTKEPKLAWEVRKLGSYVQKTFNLRTGSQVFLHIEISWGALWKHTFSWVSPPEILIKLIGGRVWASGFLKTPWAILVAEFGNTHVRKVRVSPVKIVPVEGPACSKTRGLELSAFWKVSIWSVRRKLGGAGG